MLSCIQAKAEYDARVAIAGLDPTDPDAYSKECNITVKVGKEHFEAVAKTVRLFDDYLYASCAASTTRVLLTLV